MENRVDGGLDVTLNKVHPAAFIVAKKFPARTTFTLISCWSDTSTRLSMEKSLAIWKQRTRAFSKRQYWP